LLQQTVQRQRSWPHRARLLLRLLRCVLSEVLLLPLLLLGLTL
jgi:hypothetical protein